MDGKVALVQLFITDRYEVYQGAIKTLISAVDTRELNGENALTISSLAQLEKGARIVWRDLKGRWRENIVASKGDERADKGVTRSYYCPNSAIELRGDYLQDKRPGLCSASTALASALSTSRWQVGEVDGLGIKQINFYHTNAWQAIHDIADAFGGELRFDISVSGDKITSRKVSIKKQVGADTGKRFVYSKDLISCVREVADDDVCTALYGYGKALQSTDDDGELTGGFSRKLTFGAVNSGVDWTGDASAKAIWGRPDGRGGKEHVFGDVEFQDCEDPTELLRLTKEALKIRSKPQVSYSISVLALRNAGQGIEGADEGDTVTVIDPELGIRILSRITKVMEDQLDETATTYEFGTFSTVADAFRAQKSAINNAANSVAAYSDDHTDKGLAGLGDDFGKKVDAAIKHGDEQVKALKAEMDKIPADIRDQIVDMINSEINTTGGWVYEVPGEGIYVYDKKPPTSTKCVKIGGGIIGVANSKKSDGTWNWRTAVDGSGIVADQIYTGRITGGNSYFDLDSGTINMRDGIINITDTEGNTVTISPSLGFQVRDRYNKMIAGTVITSDNKAMFMTDAVGSSEYYVTTGVGIEGEKGSSFVYDGEEMFGIYKMGTDGYRFDSYGTTNLTCYPGLGMRIGPGGGSGQGDTELHLSTGNGPNTASAALYAGNSRLSIETDEVMLQANSYTGMLSMTKDYILLKFDSTHYLSLDRTDAVFRMGSKGFGMLNGQFYSEITFN